MRALLEESFRAAVATLGLPPGLPLSIFSRLHFFGMNSYFGFYALAGIWFMNYYGLGLEAISLALLVIGRVPFLGLVVPDITNPFWTTVARGVEDAAQSHSYSVLLCNTDESPTKQLRYLDVVASQRVDGVIIAPCDSDVRNLDSLRTRAVPAVGST